MRVSIRYRALLVITAVLVVTLSFYLYLATTLFARDKLASVYDLNAALVTTISEETDFYLLLLADKLDFFARQAFSVAREPAEREALADAFLAREPEIVRVEIHERAPGAAAFTPVVRRSRPETLAELSITVPDLEETRQNWPVPFTELASMSLYVRNNSLPPDAALLTIALPLPRAEGEPERAAVIDLKASRLLRILGRSELYTTYLVAGDGTVLAHPEAQVVLDRRSLRQRPIVKGALEGRIKTGVHDFVQEDGVEILGSFSKLDNGGAVVVSEIPRALALRTNRVLVQRSLLFGVAVVLAAFVASVFFARLLTLPILRLKIAARAAVRGHLDVPVKTKARDEIGDLAASFYELLAHLRQAHAKLTRNERLALLGRLGRAAADRVEAAGGPGAALVADYLALARLEDEPTTAMALNTLAQRGLDVCAPELTRAHVEVERHLAADLPPVKMRPARLQQAVINLIVNACEAMPNGGKLVLTTNKDELGRLCLVVRDSGRGIDPALHQRIFEPFFTTKPASEGAGLGLAIVYETVHDHEGIILVESEPGCGATFTIVLPPA